MDAVNYHIERTAANENKFLGAKPKEGVKGLTLYESPHVTRPGEFSAFLSTLRVLFGLGERFVKRTIIVLVPVKIRRKHYYRKRSIRS